MTNDSALNESPGPVNGAGIAKLTAVGVAYRRPLGR